MLMRSVLQISLRAVCLTSFTMSSFLCFLWVRGEYVVDWFQCADATKMQGFANHHGCIDLTRITSLDPLIPIPIEPWSHHHAPATEDNRYAGPSFQRQLLGFAWGSGDVAGAFPRDRIRPEYSILRVPLWFPLLVSSICAIASACFLLRSKMCKTKFE